MKTIDHLLWSWYSFKMSYFLYCFRNTKISALKTWEPFNLSKIYINILLRIIVSFRLCRFPLLVNISVFPLLVSDRKTPWRGQSTLYQRSGEFPTDSHLFWSRFLGGLKLPWLSRVISERETFCVEWFFWCV